MAYTPSTMLPLGTSAPDFSLIDCRTEKVLSLRRLKSEKATVIMFICNHCPFVVHVREELVKLTNDYIIKEISFIAINSNDAETYPQDGPEKMKELAEECHFPFPYLFDETQDIAKAYQAACTPDFYIFDKNLKLVYRGQMDGSRPGNDIPVNGRDLRTALDNILHGGIISDDQKPSVGCNIKWK